MKYENSDGTYKHLSELYQFLQEDFNTDDSTLKCAKEVFVNDQKLCLAITNIILNTKKINIARLGIDILSKIFPKTGVFSENMKTPLVQFFTRPETFAMVFKMLQAIHLLSSFDHSKSSINEWDLKILRLLEALHSKRPRHQFSVVSEEDVEYIFYLIIDYKDSKEHAEILLPMIRQICRTKKFCKTLSRRKLFDSLHDMFVCTQQNDIVSRIIRIISKNTDCMEEMKHSVKLCNLIINLVNNYSKTKINKKYLIGILYKILKKVPEMISLQPVHNGLIDFLEKHNNLEEKSLRLTIIKVYTLLNLQLEMEIIPTLPIKYELKLPVEIRKKLNQEFALDSDNEQTDEEEFDNEDDDIKSNDSDSSDGEGSIISSVSSEDFAVITSKGDTSEMRKFYKEIHMSDYPEIDDGNENSEIFNHLLPQFEGNIQDNPNNLREIIFKSIKKADYIVGLAYPDMVRAESTNEEEKLDFRIHQISFHNLMEKLEAFRQHYQGQCKKSVYDLDYLLTKSSESEKNTKCITSLENYDFSHESNIYPKKKSRMENDYTKDVSSSPTLEFESRFESGNLRSVEQVGEYEYNIFLSPDTSTSRGHKQWFYFEVSNMTAGKPYTFNVVNFDKINSQFNYGMQPVMFSVTSFLLKHVEWIRLGEQVLYYGNNYTDEESNIHYRTLTFTITFEYSYDHCYIAYHYPYTYTKLMAELLLTKINLNKSSNIYSRIDSLCNTLGNNCLPLVTITNKSHLYSIPYEGRPIIFMAARVHPGETNSSWIMHGILKSLHDPNDENANIAREHYIFKIIPMLNPDGCISGNTRSGLAGCDLNRRWQNPDKMMHPEIFYTKKLVEYAKKNLKQPIGAFIDIHGHSRKKFFFFYGCNPASSWNKKDKLKVDNFNYTMIPEEVSINKNMKKSFCHYRIDKHKESTARVVMWREFGIKNSLTLECSYCSGEDKKKMTTGMLQDIGKSLISALANIALKKKDITK